MHADADADANWLGAYATCRPTGAAGAKASTHCKAVKATAHSTPVERLRKNKTGTRGKQAQTAHPRNSVSTLILRHAGTQTLNNAHS